MSNDSKDFIAVLFIGAGSSFARGPDKEEVAKRVWKIAREDWRSLFDFGPIKKREVNVWDVTGHEKIWWDATGMFDEETNKRIDTLEIMEVVA